MHCDFRPAELAETILAVSTPVTHAGLGINTSWVIISQKLDSAAFLLKAVIENNYLAAEIHIKMCK